tara:strand:+ start:477 stop:881 length:405 start_codon:yes stop_codon:yes gene_type:complete
VTVGQQIKESVLGRIANGHAFSFMGNAKWRIGQKVIHVRFCSSPKSGAIFPYNINKNTLTADFELWICRDADTFYLFPSQIMRDIYEDPDAYVDRHHPDIRVAEVDTQVHRLLFGKGGKSFDASPYFRSVLQDS